MVLTEIYGRNHLHFVTYLTGSSIVGSKEELKKDSNENSEVDSDEGSRGRERDSIVVIEFERRA